MIDWYLGFLLIVVMAWQGISLIQYVRKEERELRQTLKGRVMYWTAIGTLIESGLALIALFARWVVPLVIGG